MMNGVDTIVAIIDAALPPVSPVAAVVSTATAPASQSGGSAESRPPKKTARKKTASGGGTGAGTPPAEDEAALNLRLAFLPRTDLGNAERFRERNRGKLLYCETLPGSARSEGGWLCWDGRRWSRDNAQAKARLAEHACVRGIQDEADACAKEADRLAARHADIVERKRPGKPKKPSRRGDNVIEVEFRAKTVTKRPPKAKDLPPDEPPAPEATREEKRDAAKLASRITLLYRTALALRSWGRQSEANSKMVPIARHASAYLLIDQAELDVDLHAFNLWNGTLVFRSEWPPTKPVMPGDDEAGAIRDSIAGHEAWLTVNRFVKLKPHDPDDRITKLSPVSFDADATCPMFEKFLGEVQPKPAMRSFLQDWKGYSMTGDTGEARMALFLGGGRNGKGVFETATGFVLGDYTGSTPVETFLLEGHSRSASQATPELAKLPGIRALRTSEPDKGARVNEGLIKLATGQDPIDARHLNRPFFTFMPHFKLTMSANARPKIFGTDEGIWARITVVPWSVFVPPEKRDPLLAKKLESEAPGILNWMLAGLSQWMQHGLRLPEDVVAATADYRRDSDQLGRWLEAATVVDAEGRVQSSAALASFNAWARANGEAEWKGKGFSNAMTDRGFKKDKSSVMFWLGLRLTKTESDFVDADGRPRTRVGGGEPPPAQGGDGEEFTL